MNMKSKEDGKWRGLLLRSAHGNQTQEQHWDCEFRLHRIHPETLSTVLPRERAQVEDR